MGILWKTLKTKAVVLCGVIGDWEKSGECKVLTTAKYKCEKAKVYNVDMISEFVFVQGNNHCAVCVCV